MTRLARVITSICLLAVALGGPAAVSSAAPSEAGALPGWGSAAVSVSSLGNEATQSIHSGALVAEKASAPVQTMVSDSQGALLGAPFHHPLADPINPAAPVSSARPPMAEAVPVAGGA